MNKKIKKIKNTFQIDGDFVGWGRKKSGLKAVLEAKRDNNSSFLLLEDGFIRSIGLGIEGWDSFSIVVDDIGIYYDATMPSKLENILNFHTFSIDELDVGQNAIELIRKYKISKYNNATLKLPEYLNTSTSKVLIVAQTKGDMSLKYGMADQFDPKDMIQDAIKHNPDSEIYLKVHPDVLTGKKKSNIDIKYAKQYVKIITDNINPLVLLEKFDKVYTQTSQMGFEALLLGKKVYVYGMPFYAGWGVTYDQIECKRRKRKLSILDIFTAAYIIYSRYFNPFSQQPINIIDAIETIYKYRELYASNNGKLYFFGFKPWKRKQTKVFFKPLNKNKIYFCRDLNYAIKKGLDKNSKVYIWGKQEYKTLESYCDLNDIDIYRVEDGFIRSVSLGSDLTKAYSIVVDYRGIYFDPEVESDLEYIIKNYKFDQALLQRAEKLQQYLVEKKFSKYNLYQDKKFNFKTDKKVILVIGQVEDDASIIYGGNGMSNLELLKKVYDNRKNEFIIYKPHPDVDVGNRKGSINKEIALKYADKIISEVSLPSLIDICDEVHTITSLSGFEALLREKKVYTYGMPFYAGWGLTIDEKECKRRDRELNILELIAATYFIYPLYISPVSNDFCEVEELIVNLDIMKKRYNNGLYKLIINMRNVILRVLQSILKKYIMKY